MPTLAHTPDGRRFEIGRRIAHPPARAWDVLVDTRLWPEWGPTVSAVDGDVDRIEAGTTGRLQVLGGPWLSFEILSCVAPTDGNGRWTWRVARVPATGHRVEPLAEGQCRVVFELPPVAVGYVPVCRRALGLIERCLDHQNSD